MDTEKEENASFLVKYPVSVWPTFFLIDVNHNGKGILSVWTGSASLKEMREWIEEGVRNAEVSTSHNENLVLAYRSYASGDFETSLSLFQDAAKAMAAEEDPSRIYLNWIDSLYKTKKYDKCLEIGSEHQLKMKGAAAPVDHASILIACSAKLAEKNPRRMKAEKLVIDSLEWIVQHPHSDSSVDDRADALSVLAEAYLQQGDSKKSNKSQQEKLLLLETAAKKASTPEHESAFDYGRATAYMALNRHAEAIQMLQKRIQQLPNSYEPVARLGQVYMKMQKWEDALPHLQKAIELSYGPRKMNYIRSRGEAFEKLKRKEEYISMLRFEVNGYEKLPPGQANSERLLDAKRRLDLATKEKNK